MYLLCYRFLCFNTNFFFLRYVRRRKVNYLKKKKNVKIDYYRKYLCFNTLNYCYLRSCIILQSNYFLFEIFSLLDFNFEGMKI